MTLKTTLYERWGQKATDAAKIMNEKGYYSAEHKVAKYQLAAYQDGCRLLHEEDGFDHVKTGLRSRMKSTFTRDRRDFYARMLNDVESALAADKGSEAQQ